LRTFVATSRLSGVEAIQSSLWFRSVIAPSWVTS
jgi:hypothetical protein